MAEPAICPKKPLIPGWLSVTFWSVFTLGLLALLMYYVVVPYAIRPAIAWWYGDNNVAPAPLVVSTTQQAPATAAFDRATLEVDYKQQAIEAAIKKVLVENPDIVKKILVENPSLLPPATPVVLATLPADQQIVRIVAPDDGTAASPTAPALLQVTPAVSNRVDPLTLDPDEVQVKEVPKRWSLTYESAGTMSK